MDAVEKSSAKTLQQVGEVLTNSVRYFSCTAGTIPTELGKCWRLKKVDLGLNYINGERSLGVWCEFTAVLWNHLVLEDVCDIAQGSLPRPLPSMLNEATHGGDVV